MSRNCIKCMVNERTGLDLICDTCQAKKVEAKMVLLINLISREIVAVNDSREAAIFMLGRDYSKWQFVCLKSHSFTGPEFDQVKSDIDSVKDAV